MVRLPGARGPDGLRIYAIGDVHGCLDELGAVSDMITADLARRPVADHRIVLLGDYVDRGPDSAGVLAWVAERIDDPFYVFLRGNHDAMCAGFLADPDDPDFETWVGNGGAECLVSFGVAPRRVSAAVTRAGRSALSADFRQRTPEPVQMALGRLRLMARFGDFLFVHAGLRPGVPLAQQREDDLLWIRGPFLEHEGSFGAVVVHGHTPSPRIEIRPNRIGIDTGAVFGGALSCLVIEEHWVGRLGPSGAEPLPLPGTGAAGALL